MCGTHGLDATDGLHEVLGGGPADGEEPLDVLAGPGLGAGEAGAFAEVVKFAGPLDGAWHGITSETATSG